MHINELNPERLLIFGDVHGHLHEVRRALDAAQEQGIYVVVQVGDFGVWQGRAGDAFLESVALELQQRDMWLLFVDGNHENFDRLYSFPIDPTDGTRPLRPRLAHLPRGLRWEWRGVRFTALGGAHSVDRQWRTADVDWWPEEWVLDSDLELVREGGQTDVLFMHDSPSGAPNAVCDDPFNPGNKIFPKDDLDEAALHRRRLAYAVDAVEPLWIFHGHYHKRMSGTYTPAGASRPCNVIGLDEGGTQQDYDFMIVVDLSELVPDAAADSKES